MQKFILKFILKFSFIFLFFINISFALPNGFVYLKEMNPTIIQDIRYATSHNFLGRPVAGYQSGECILTKQAALALSNVQKELQKFSLGLKVYDCYRPEQAVQDFMAWSKDMNDQIMKKSYYPNINKQDVFKLGYVAEKSGHSRGSTIDLTIVRLSNKKASELDMGTRFDFMDEKSHVASKKISQAAHNHRMYLQTVMQANGFKPLDVEWWHFTLKDEPFPNEYFNFPVK